MLSRGQLAARYDVVIVGARCAGAGTAMLLARRGLRVLAVDRTSSGSDTCSTHALMRGAVHRLHRWGVLDAIVAAGTPPIREASFHYGSTEHRVPIRARDGVDALYAPRRTVLDRLLVDAAIASGAEVRHRTRVIDVVWGQGGAVTGVELVDPAGRIVRVAADLVVGADGLRSSLAQRVGAKRYRVQRHASATVYGYWSGMSSPGYGWYYAPGASVGVIPTNGDEACVFLALPPERFRRLVASEGVPVGFAREVAEGFPAVAAAINAGRQSGPLRAFAGTPGFLRKSYGRGWALAGDAGYFRDPITAHGITDALRDAALLAGAIVQGENALREYERARDELSVDILAVSDEIASFEWTLDELAGKHERLNVAMKRELAALDSAA